MTIEYRKLTENDLTTFIEIRIGQHRKEGAKEDFDLRPNLMDYYKRHIGVAHEFLTRVISEAKAYGCG